MAGYTLAVDLGTTWTAAAVATGERTALVSLTHRSPTIPTVVHVAADGTTLVGEAAERRALEEPERVVREVKRRVGDSAPVIVGGTPWAAELLLARVLRWVVDTVSAEQNGPPDRLTVTHPANWASFKRDLLVQAARQVGLPDVHLVPEPVAAAAWYATEHRVETGQRVAVYDLGGGTFDTAVVERTADGFEIRGRPDGVERLGGIDFDAAVLAHVAAEVGDAWGALDPTDPDTLADVAELRRQCVEAKEALSNDTATSIPVRLPGVRTTVRLTRAELEAMVRPALAETTAALRRTLDSAGVDPADLAAVLLVGGASRMPVVAEIVATDLGMRVAVDANPKHAVVLGALAATLTAAAEPAAEPAPPRAVPAPPPEPEPVTVAEPVPVVTASGPNRRRPLLLAGAGAVALVALVAGVLALQGDDEDPGRGGSVETGDGSETATTTGANTAEPAFEPGDGRFAVGVVEPLGNAAQPAVDELNAAGGVLGQPVELVVGDSATFRDAGVDLVVGPDADTADVGDAARCVTGGPTAPDDRTVDLTPNDEAVARALVEAALIDGHIGVGLVTPADDPVGSLVGDALEAAGATLDPLVEYDPEGLDPAAIVSRLNDSGSTAAILVGSAGLADITGIAASAGYLGPLYADASFDDESVGRRVADGVAGGVTVQTIVPPAAELLAYDCVVLAAVAVEVTGSDHPDAIAAAWVDASRDGALCNAVECLVAAAGGANIDYAGASGPVDLTDDGTAGGGTFERYQWSANVSKDLVDTIVIE